VANRSHDFRQSHINHIGSALKAAVDAGVANPQVRVRLPSGAELHVGPGDRPAAATAVKPVAAVQPVAAAVVRPRARTPVRPAVPPRRPVR
jgi:hypothetical protein